MTKNFSFMNLMLNLKKISTYQKYWRREELLTSTLFLKGSRKLLYLLTDFCIHSRDFKLFESTAFIPPTNIRFEIIFYAQYTAYLFPSQNKKKSIEFQKLPNNEILFMKTISKRIYTETYYAFLITPSLNVISDSYIAENANKS